MSRFVTYEKNRMPQLKMRLAEMFRQMDAFGYGSRAFAAKWLMENGHQKGNPDTQKDVNRVAKKVSHILKGYVRGIHPTMHNGGVWSAEEAEHIVTLLETWLQENPDIDDMEPAARPAAASLGRGRR